MARRSYTAEFKREAVRLASKPGMSRRAAARELVADTLPKWREFTLAAARDSLAASGCVGR